MRLSYLSLFPNTKYRVFKHLSGALQEPQQEAKKLEFQKLWHRVGRFLDIQDSVHYMYPTHHMRVLRQQSCYKEIIFNNLYS